MFSQRFPSLLEGFSFSGCKVGLLCTPWFLAQTKYFFTNWWFHWQVIGGLLLVLWIRVLDQDSSKIFLSLFPSLSEKSTSWRIFFRGKFLKAQVVLPTHFWSSDWDIQNITVKEWGDMIDHTKGELSLSSQSNLISCLKRFHHHEGILFLLCLVEI